MKGYLSLRSGETFEGTLHHLETTKQSDIVVYTGMSGFCEVITNPAYANKMVVACRLERRHRLRPFRRNAAHRNPYQRSQVSPEERHS